MPPVKSICSLIAQGYEIYYKAWVTINDIREALRKTQRTKNSILYGGLSILDTVGAELFSSVQSVASSIVSSLMKSYSALVAAAVESFLSPFLYVLISGPESVFALINLPLEEAKKAAAKERMYLNRAGQNIDIVLSIISRWTIEVGGGKYAEKMMQALPYIERAIRNSESLIAKLDVANENSDKIGLSREYTSSFFDQATYNTLRSNIRNAINITKSDSVIMDYDSIEARRKQYSDKIYGEYYSKITAKYRSLSRAVSKKYFGSNQSPKDVAEYTAAGLYLKRAKDVELKNARAKADREAALNPELYADIWSDVQSKWAFESQELVSNLALFSKHIGLAYLNYRNCQSMTHSVYTIRSLISRVISSMIMVIQQTGNSMGRGAAWSLNLSQSLLEKVRDIFNDSLRRFNGSESGGISSTGLSLNLAVGHRLLVTVDSTIGATITQSLIDAINADEAYNNENKKIENLSIEIHDIPDWDGKLGVWAVNPLESVAPPYVTLVASAAAALSTMVAVGLVPNSEALGAIRARIIEMNRKFRKIKLHNSRVSRALYTYTPIPNPYVEQVREILSRYTNINVWLTTFNVVSALVALGMDADAMPVDVDDTNFPNTKNCKAAYKDLFSEDVLSGALIGDTAKLPTTMVDSYTSKHESNDVKNEMRRRSLESTSISIDSTCLKNTTMSG